MEISTTKTEAAQMLNVSRESVVSDKKILDQGSEELTQKVDAGEIAVVPPQLISQPSSADDSDLDHLFDKVRNLPNG